ncbi:MAG TPA: right-handed parallel beta-helix repeat-containing protein [Gaiellaceae bacterium]|nr:right-handed parallel beta-helix repeat-containing protein [Gaiellaceae bacterium]
MSYTLRGRLESRLATTLLPFAVAGVLAALLREWWPLQLAALMLAVGVALDAALYHRLLPYQPAWLALPLGLVELGLVVALAWRFDVMAPLGPALAFYAGAWLQAQVLGHAVFPLARLTYGEDGGELGRGGGALRVAAPALAVAALGIAAVAQPPTVRLPSGVVDGPLVLDRPQTVLGDSRGGTVVRGGIVITSDDVTLRDVRVVGGAIGIEVRDADDVRLERVHVSGASEDGISARRSSVAIRDCVVRMPRRPDTQSIDISFSAHLDPSSVRRCTVEGGAEGIVAHLAPVSFRENHVSRTTMRAIAITEMSMGDATRNVVEDAEGVGIFCGDYSHCDVVENSVTGTRPDGSGVRSRAGYGAVSHYYSWLELRDNQLDRGAAAFLHARIEHR